MPRFSNRGYVDSPTSATNKWTRIWYNVIGPGRGLRGSNPEKPWALVQGGVTERDTGFSPSPEISQVPF